jgi:YD repeat-containing protein
LTLGNGQQQDNHYDAVGKLTARHLFNPNQTLIATFQWQHDAAGNVTQQTERWLGDTTRNNALRTTTMAYDDVYRLTGETVEQDGETTTGALYTYDAASNRASKVKVENGLDLLYTIYTYNAANQLTAWSESNDAPALTRTAVMTYDARGNRASTAITTHDEEPTSATTTYTWTPQNMLSSVTLLDSSVHSYAYDYRVRRITRTESSANPVAMTFSGGLSVAEFEVTDSQLNTLNAQRSTHRRVPARPRYGRRCRRPALLPAQRSGEVQPEQRPWRRGGPERQHRRPHLDRQLRSLRQAPRGNRQQRRPSARQHQGRRPHGFGE